MSGENLIIEWHVARGERRSATTRAWFERRTGTRGGGRQRGRTMIPHCATRRGEGSKVFGCGEEGGKKHQGDVAAGGVGKFGRRKKSRGKKEAI